MAPFTRTGDFTRTGSPLTPTLTNPTDHTRGLMISKGTSPAPVAGRTESTAAETEGTTERRRSRRHGPATAPPALAPPRTRRRPGVLAAGVALVALGSLTAAYLTQTAGGTVAVVAVVRDVAPGEVVQAADLTTADISTDPALAPVPADRMRSVIGQRAAAALTAGSLLTDAAVTADVVPPQGRSLVGVALTAAQLPAEPLQPGDQVRIVDTPTPQGEPPVTSPTSIAGEVASTVGPDETGLTVVNVTVPSGQAADLAARVATGRVALVLDSRER